MELVSAVIPVYNGVRTIARAVRSALDQDYAPLEVIVINDGSSDATEAVLSGFGSAIINFKQANAGPAVARNRGIERARGNFIAFLDADDFWLPGKISILARELRENPSATLAFSDVMPINEDGSPLTVSMMPRECAHAPSMSELFARWWPILPSAVMMRRDAIVSCGGFDRAFRRPGYEDPLLWLQARRLGEFRYIDQPLTGYHLEPELVRMEKYAGGLKVFAERVRNEFGEEGEPLLKELIRAHLSALGSEGIRALALGDRAGARRAFRCALRYAPAHPRSLSRLVRSYLPTTISTLLSSPRRRRRWHEFGIGAPRHPARI